MEEIPSIIKDIRDCIDGHGIKTYNPGQHKGDCTEPYIVVSLNGVTSLLNVSSERPLYMLMVYVPWNNYSMLEQITYNVKQWLKELYPMIEYAGNETPAYYSSDNKSYMVSFQYQGIRKIERW